MTGPNPVPLLRKPTLSAQVARYLLDLIAKQGLRPGDAVPSEVQICKDLQVSRGSVREAYRTIAALGILDIESGRRPRLQAVSPSVLEQVFGYALKTAQVSATHVIQTRRAIEVQAAQLASRNVTEAQKRTLRELVREMRVALGENDHARRIKSDMAIHVALAEASGNPLNPLLLAALRAPLEQVMSIDLESQRSASDLVRVIDVHDGIVERVCAGDAVGAGAAMAMHFDLSIGSSERTEHAAVEAEVLA
jgi:DNA-binding FadR family transcriptional regulator